MKELSSYVRTIPDFPIPGIMFRDITGILDSAEGFAFSIDELAKRAEKLQFDLVAGIESRGFIFAAPLALRFQKPFIPFRKKGKLPGKTIQQEFKLEYGSSILEVNENAVRPGQRVLIVDKNKDGSLGSVRLDFDPEHMRFTTAQRSGKTPPPDQVTFKELPDNGDELPF